MLKVLLLASLLPACYHDKPVTRTLLGTKLTVVTLSNPDKKEIIQLGCMSDEECAKGTNKPGCQYGIVFTVNICKSVKCCKGDLCNSSNSHSSLILIAIFILAISFLSK
uniref:UPAR/Ly6 domain-containing protein n=1 Tax=Pristionchus pacificus TaxID=54126 RepID=A0A8R1UNY6_PRIPA